MCINQLSSMFEEEERTQLCESFNKVDFPEKGSCLFCVDIVNYLTLNRKALDAEYNFEKYISWNDSYFWYSTEVNSFTKFDLKTLKNFIKHEQKINSERDLIEISSTKGGGNDSILLRGRRTTSEIDYPKIRAEALKTH